MDGMALCRMARQLDPTLMVLVLTGFPTIETAVESMKLGAADYLTKPFFPDDLLATARRLLAEKRLREEISCCSARSSGPILLTRSSARARQCRSCSRSSDGQQRPMWMF